MLLEHNLPVYQELCETLEKYRKAIVVVHTGGGKSYIANEFLTEKKLNALVVCPKRTMQSKGNTIRPKAPKSRLASQEERKTHAGDEPKDSAYCYAYAGLLKKMQS